MVELQAQQNGAAVVVTIAGDMDALTAEEVVQFINAQIERGQVALVADLSRVDFMSSAGLRVILAAVKAARASGGDFRLAGPQPGVSRTLNLAGFGSFLQIFPTVGEAVASFQPAA